MRTLASIQKISAIDPILGADAIEVASVLGWKVVVRKGEFKVGELACYCEIDSILPYEPWCQFLWKKGDLGKPTHRLKTVKLRGQISQGLLLPLSVMDGRKFPTDVRENPIYPRKEGMNISALLGITKYEPVIPPQLAGQVKGQFPCFIPKTDEVRVQAEPSVLQEIAGKQVVITTKIDGTSCTIYFNRGELGICSRNLELIEDETNTFWKLANRYTLRDKLKMMCKNLAIQGEVAGPGIQKNRLKLKDHELFVFNVFDIDNGVYLKPDHASEIIVLLGLKPVPVEYVGPFTPDWTVDKLLEMAKGNYPDTDNPKEGIVIRPVEEMRSEALKGRLSFKVVNNDFLMAGGD